MRGLSWGKEKSPAESARAVGVTAHPRPSPLISTQPAEALRSLMAPRFGRLLNPRRKAYQPPRL